MKKLLIILVVFASCVHDNKPLNESQYHLILVNGDGMGESRNVIKCDVIKCDSFIMVSDKEAVFWRYGTKNIAKANQYISASSTK